MLYGLFEVFSTFAELWSTLMLDDRVEAGFDTRIVARRRESFRCFAGAPVAPHRVLSEVEAADVVIVTDLAVDPREDHRERWSDIGPWLRGLHEGGATICSVCSGSVLLAAAGLLDGHAATTHWGYVEHFRTYFPAVDLQPNRVLLPTGTGNRIVTTGGMAAWEDLALYLIARFYGEAVAIRAAKLFLFGDHSEGQLLYAARLMPKRVEDAAIARAQAWVAEHYAAPGCVERMAAISGLPERTFKRRFRKATGFTPLEYVQTLRIEEAKHILESTDEAIDAIVETVGYDDPASFRRLFKRLTGVAPGRYRRRYQEITRYMK
ncbi:MAG: helix-turn-helix domain-containing protein [Gammaproteobacteria bacterium]|nr:helix-turn-helix domain-containing protein [Gammaproteobacteria bacterium]